MRHLTTLAAFVVGCAFVLSVPGFAFQFTNEATLATPRYFGCFALLQNGNILVIGGRSGTDAFERSCELFNPLTGIVTPAGSLLTPRYLSTCVLLRDGRVLVTGGRNSSGVLASCELYNPESNSWTTTGSFRHARSAHTLTLLYDGRVLATGGINSRSTKTAEIFDPQTGVWTETDPVPGIARNNHTAVLLRDSTVLVVGGYSTEGGISHTNHIFHPTTQSWSSAGSMLQGSGDHTLTLLPNNQVLLTSGWPLSLNRCELYNPATRQWTPATPMQNKRTIPTMTLLPNGQVLAMGGYDSYGNDQSEYTIAACEFFTPETGQWTETLPLPESSEGHSAIVSATGKVIVAGGGSRHDTYALNPQKIFRSILSLDLSSPSLSEAGNLRARHNGHTATILPDGKALIAGGAIDCNTTSILDSCELFDYRTRSWTLAASLHQPRTLHTATLLPDGTVLVVGGKSIQNSIAQAIATAERYNYKTSSWMQAAPAATARFHHSATLLTNGQLVVVGGAQGSAPEYLTWQAIGNAEIYDYKTNTWQALPSMRTERFGHTATLLPNGKLLVTGGRNTTTGVLSTAEVYDPATNMWESAAPMQKARLFHTATLLPNGRVLVTGGLYNERSAEVYDYTANTWLSAGERPDGASQQRATLLPNGEVLFAGGIVSNASGLGSPIEIYSPALNRWRLISRFPFVLANSTPLLLPDNSVLLCGGYFASSCNGNTAGFIITNEPDYKDEDRPVISDIRFAPYVDNLATIALTGTYFQGRHGSEGSSGNFYTSASNYPLVEIRRIGGDHNDNDFVQYLPFNTLNSAWSGTSTSVLISNKASLDRQLPAGYYRLSVIANGIPSLPVFFGVADTGILINNFPTTVDSTISFFIAPRCRTYPNPAADYLTVEGTLPGAASGDITVEVCDLPGRVVTRQSMPATRNYRCELPLGTLPQGTYTVRVRYRDEVQSSCIQIVR